MPDGGSLYRDKLHWLTDITVFCWTVTLRLCADWQALPHRTEILKGDFNANLGGRERERSVAIKFVTKGILLCYSGGVLLTLHGCCATVAVCY